ncbi:MAG TPA: type II toxin-antitoxin system VapC family toxin [Chloroflexi bacterium]|nr:type II toxin-antitoxin system VapC family toxin [Chloroflexota bacterium]
MMLAIADTHAIIWYLLNDPRLSTTARAIFDDAVTRSDPVGIPAISIVEIVYLTEKRRIPPAALQQLKQELLTGQAVLKLIPLTEEIALRVQTVARSAIPDMPDRIIAATALYFNLPLISRDRKIQASNINTIW